jgi:hypothetical protein
VCFSQELWESQTQAWDDPAVDLAKTVAEVALDDAGYGDTGVHADALGDLQLQGVPGMSAGAAEPAFKDTGTAESSDEETEAQELPAWACACAHPHPTDVWTAASSGSRGVRSEKSWQ